ncbi:chymotrypsin-1-like [Arctopsyche grandis]|uniref:chymotrypsin-1-like n=1 Tax=Arctopsyche grandis TaxID=121162 RepID=UPI00406D7BA0
MAFKVLVFLLAVAACSNGMRISPRNEYHWNRIVGGAIAPPGFAPFAVSLRSGLLIKSHFCGGSIISLNYVITAAHCVDAMWNGNSLTSSLEVLAGSNTLNGGGVKSSVSGNFTHPDWDTSEIKNDVGIFILTSSLVATDLIKPIALNAAIIGNNAPLTAVGWGLTRYPGISGSNELKYLETPAMGHDECTELRNEIAATYPGAYPDISMGEICTFHSRGQGTCQGDSGSALYNENGLVGIVSWGLPCARGAPDVFTRVSYYRDWILNVIN